LTRDLVLGSSTCTLVI